MSWTLTAANKDRSRRAFEKLADEGYTTIKWEMSMSPCPVCRELNNKSFDIGDFISGLSYDAPVFEHSHVNCNCAMIVLGPGLEKKRVDWEGNIETI